MCKPLFSIIIPLYNKEKYIKDTINCVLQQTIANFELLIIDDGSTDNSVEIVKKFLDGRIKIIHQKNSGVSAARNNGIRQAKGKYITFLDADDEWTNNFLETCLKLFHDFPTARMVCPSYQMKYEKKIITPHWRSVSRFKSSLVTDFFEMATAPCWIMTSSCVAIDKEVFKHLDYLFAEDEKVYEDLDMWLRLGANYPVAHSPQICSIYNRITESNARKNTLIVYSKHFMQTLDYFISSENYTRRQKEWLYEIKDRRFVPYIFSLLLAGERKKGREVIRTWKPASKYILYKWFLLIASHMPYFLLKIIQSIRLKVF